MVTDYLITTFTSVVHAVLSVLPTITVPSWLSQSGPVATVFSDAGSMGVWFPTPLAVSVAAAIFAAWAIGWAIKLARIVASFLTAGGGSAA